MTGSMTGQTAGPSTTRLYLFGDLEIHRGEASIRLPTRKTELLLAYLALYPQAHGRETLAALFWGDVGDEQARGSLRKALTALRRTLGPDAFLADRHSIALNPDYPLWVDVVEFDQLDMRSVVAPDQALALGSAGPTALDLYRGDLLGEFYEDWIAPLREHYRSVYLERRLALAQEYRTRSEYGQAIDQAQRALAVEPANERAHQHLMFAYLALGRRGEALRQYELARRALQEELAVTPSAETTAPEVSPPAVTSRRTPRATSSRASAAKKPSTAPATFSRPYRCWAAATTSGSAEE